LNGTRARCKEKKKASSWKKEKFRKILRKKGGGDVHHETIVKGEGESPGEERGDVQPRKSAQQKSPEKGRNRLATWRNIERGETFGRGETCPSNKRQPEIESSHVVRIFPNRQLHRARRENGGVNDSSGPICLASDAPTDEKSVPPKNPAALRSNVSSCRRQGLRIKVKKKASGQSRTFRRESSQGYNLRGGASCIKGPRKVREGDLRVAAKAGRAEGGRGFFKKGEKKFRRASEGGSTTLSKLIHQADKGGLLRKSIDDPVLRRTRLTQGGGLRSDLEQVLTKGARAEEVIGEEKGESFFSFIFFDERHSEGRGGHLSTSFLKK